MASDLSWLLQQLRSKVWVFCSITREWINCGKWKSLQIGSSSSSAEAANSHFMFLMENIWIHCITMYIWVTWTFKTQLTLTSWLKAQHTFHHATCHEKPTHDHMLCKMLKNAWHTHWIMQQDAPLTPTLYHAVHAGCKKIISKCTFWCLRLMQAFKKASHN